MKRKIIFALIILIIAISSVSASDVNLTDNQDLAIDDMTEDTTLTTDDDWENDNNAEEILANLEMTDYPKNYGEKQVKFKLTNTADNSPMANVDLCVYSYIPNKDKLSNNDLLSSDSNSKPIALLAETYDFVKMTTDSKGTAVYTIPDIFKGDFNLLAGLYSYEHNGGPFDDVTINYNGKETHISLVQKVDVTMSKLDVAGSLKLSKEGTFYDDVVLKATLVSTLNEPLANEDIEIKFSNGKTVTITTNSRGIATYNIPFNSGSYSATAKVVSKKINADSANLNNIVISKVPATITPAKLTTTYASGKYFKIKVTNSQNNKALSNVKLALKVYVSNKKYKTATATTDSNGIAKYLTSSLSLGTHKVVVGIKDKTSVTGSEKTSSILIKKASYSISAPKVTVPYKQGSFKVTVKNKASKKAVSGVKVTIKVYTDKKYKTYSAKTNSRGIATFSTKALSKATHNVVVSIKKNSNYNAASAKSSIKVINGKIATTLADEGKPSAHAAFSSFISENFQRYEDDDGSLLGYAAKMTLRDTNGNELHKPIKAYNNGRLIGSGTSGEYFFVQDIGLGVIEFRFEGDSLYKPSSFRKQITIYY